MFFSSYCLVTSLAKEYDYTPLMSQAACGSRVVGQPGAPTSEPRRSGAAAGREGAVQHACVGEGRGPRMEGEIVRMPPAKGEKPFVPSALTCEMIQDFRFWQAIYKVIVPQE